MNLTTKKTNLHRILKYSSVTLASILGGVILTNLSLAQAVQDQTNDNNKNEIQSILISQASSLGRIGPSGGNGGKNFDILSHSSDIVRGIEILAGNRIDYIAFQYNTKTVGTGNRNAGHNCSISLRSNEYIHSISGKYGAVVDSLTFVIRDRHTGRYVDRHTCGGNGGNKTFSYEADPGRAIVGLFGSSGNVIDSIGVYTRPLK